MVTSDAHEALFGCNHSGCIFECRVTPCVPFPIFAPRDDMFAMLVCATHWLFMHLYMPAYMSMCGSCLLVCRLCFNTMKLWTPDPNLHLSLAGTTYYLPFCLFVIFLVCLLVCSLSCFMVCLLFFRLPCLLPYAMLPCLSCLSALCLFRIFYASFPSIACLLVSCLCLCMYINGERMHGARVQFPRRKQKGQGCEHADMSQAAVFSRFRDPTFPI